MKAVLPLLLALSGLLAGAGAGWFLRPAPDPALTGNDAAVSMPAPPARVETATLRLPNQFLVPVIADGRMRAMVVVGLALEVEHGHGITLERHEARLRAAFLQTLFDHANLGGFDGVFTAGETLIALRRKLLDTARAELGTRVHDVLVTELLRQES